MAAPASAPPALPPDTAEPMRAPVPAPSAPPTRAFCCCGVSQAERQIAAASASESVIILFIRGHSPVRRERSLARKPPQSHNSSKATMNKPRHSVPLTAAQFRGRDYA